MSNLNMPNMTFDGISERFFSRRGEATRRIAHNTTATFQTDGVHVEYLIRYHGNPIAWIAEREVAVSNAGWGTATTRARLNAVMDSHGLPFGFAQRNHAQIMYDTRTWEVLTDTFTGATIDLATQTVSL